MPSSDDRNVQVVGHKRKGDKKRTKIATNYLIQKRECLISVAHKYGFSDPDYLLNHPANAGLKKKFTNYASLPIGTPIAIPERTAATFKAKRKAEGRYVLKLVKRSRRIWFTVRLVTPGPVVKPLEKIQYLLMVRDHEEVFKGESDSNGLITCEIPYDSSYCDLIVWPWGEHHIQSVHFFIMLGSTDQKGSHCHDRCSLCNAGAGTVDVYKDKALSPHGADLLQNTDTIIPAVNLHHDLKNLVDLAGLRSDKLAELEELEEIIREKESNRESSIVYHREAFRRFVQLKQIEEQIRLHEIHIDAMVKEYKGEFYLNYKKDRKTNDLIRKKKLLAVQSGKPLRICRDFENILPFDNRYLELFGGIEAVRRELERKKKDLEITDAKLSACKGKNLPLINHRSELQRSIYLHQVQIDFSERSAAAGNDGSQPRQNSCQALPYDEKTTGRYAKDPYLKTHSLKLPHYSYPNPVIRRSAYVTREYRREKQAALSCYGGDTEIKQLTIERPPLTLFFEYNDDIGGPVRNSTILYWVSKKGEETFSDAIKGLPLMFPVGIGITNGSGMLTKSCSLAELNTLHNMIYKTSSEEIDARVQHIQAVGGNRAALTVEMLEKEPDFKVRKNGKVPAEQKDYGNILRCHDPTPFPYLEMVESYRARPEIPEAYRKISLTHFNPDLTCGFFVYPAYKGPFETRSLYDLTRMKSITGIPAALHGRIETLSSELRSSQSTIPVFCPLPEWEKRILESLARLESLFMEYEYAKVPHMQKITVLDAMQDLVNMNIKYPYYKQSDYNIQTKKTLLGHLEDLETSIFRKMTDPAPSDENNPIADILDDINDAATHLLSILESKDFLDEWRHWFKHILTISHEDLIKWYDKPDASLLPPGPYMTGENDWGTIFDTLGRAYSALAKTKLCDHVAKEDVLNGLEMAENDRSMLDYIKVDDGDIAQFKIQEDFRPERDCFRDVGESVKDYEKKGTELTIDETPTLFGIILKGFMDTTEHIAKERKIAVKLNSLLSICPGPPSLLQVVVSTYADYLNARVAKSYDPRSNPTALIRLVCLLRGMGFFGAKYTQQFYSTKTVLFKLLYDKNARGVSANGGRILQKLFYPKIDLIDTEFKVREYIEEYNLSHSNCARIYRTVFAFLSVCTVATDLRHKLEGEDEDDRAAVITALDTLQTWGSPVYTAHTLYLLKNMWKPGNSRLAGIVEARADRISSVLNGITAVVSLYDACKMIGRGEVKDHKIKFAKHAAVGVGAGAVAIGQIFEKYGEKQVFKLVAGKIINFFVREAALQYANIVPVIGQALVLCGTIINAILLIFEILEIMWELVKEPVRNMLFGPVGLEIIQLWEKFEEKPAMPVGEFPKGYELYKHHLKHNVFEEYEKDETMGRVIDDIRSLKDTFETDFDLDKSGPLFDPGAVWSHFSWHAVIPLYKAGFKIELIEKLAIVPKALFYDEREKLFEERRDYFFTYDFSIDSVQEIVDYYNECKNSNTSWFVDRVDKEDVNNPNLKFLNSKELVKRLEEGVFMPQNHIGNGYKFYQSGRWDFDHFSEPATEKGLVDLGQQIAIAITIEQSWSWNTPWKVRSAGDILSAVFYNLPIDDIKLLKYRGFRLDGSRYIDEARLAELLKAVGKKKEPSPVPPGEAGKKIVRYPIPPREKGGIPKT